jgi:hypothetical protein
MAGGDGPVAVQPQRLRPGSDADPWAGGGRYERLLEGPGNIDNGRATASAFRPFVAPKDATRAFAAADQA